jgi:hypothetical protein
MNMYQRLGAFLLLTALSGACGDTQGLTAPGSLAAGSGVLRQSNGINGYSGMQGENCTACHNNPNGPPPTVRLTGPASLAAGATGTFRLEVIPDAAATDANGGGLNVAVDAGTLIPIAGQNLILENGEITHQTPQTGSTLSWDFQWQAPTTSGTYTMYGAGMSSDLGATSGGPRDNDESAADVLQIVVGGAANNPPVANAGLDQTVTDSDNSGAEMVTLDGSASSDPDGTIATWAWFEGPTQIATGATPSVSLAVGIHTIRLDVTDNDGATDADQVIVTVQPFTPTSIDYELLSLRAAHAKVGDPLVADVRFRNIGTVEGSAMAELYVDSVKVCEQLVTDAVGRGPGRVTLGPAACGFTFSSPGDYEVMVTLTDEIGMEMLSKRVTIR